MAADAAPVDASPAVCQDGVVDGTEECDDNNDVDGDGCDSECRADHVCIITHDGGAPASVSSLRLSPVGTFTGTRRITLMADDGTAPAAVRSFAPLAACGRHVFAALTASGVIVRVDVAFDGTPCSPA